MADSLTILGTAKRVTLGTADQAEKITLPAGTRLVTLNFVTNPGKYNNTGVEAAAMTEYISIPNDQLIEKQINKDENGNLPFIFLESAVGPTVVEVLPEARQ